MHLILELQVGEGAREGRGVLYPWTCCTGGAEQTLEQIQLSKEGKGKPRQWTDPQQLGMERNYLYWHPGTTWFSEAPSPSVIVWRQQAPGRNEKAKKQISTSDIKNFEGMWKWDHHNSVTATEPGGWGDCGMYTGAVICPLAVYLQCQGEENSKECVPHTTESSDWLWQIHPSRSGRKVVETSAKVPRATQVGQTWDLCKPEQLRLLGWTSVVL